MTSVMFGSFVRRWKLLLILLLIPLVLLGLLLLAGPLIPPDNPLSRMNDVF